MHAGTYESWLPLTQSRSSAQQVVPFREAGGALRGASVVLEREIAPIHALVQMRAHRIHTIVSFQSLVLRDRLDLAQTRLGAFNHRGSDRAIESNHGIVSHALEQSI